MTDLETISLSKDPKPDTRKIREAIRNGPMDYQELKKQIIPSKGFWTGTALGRTLTGRNKTGRVVRRLGISALGVAGGIIGIDTSFLEGGGGGQLVEALAIVERICWIIGGIILTLTKGADQIEIQGERYDEREILEGKRPTMRKIKQKIKR